MIFLAFYQDSHTNPYIFVGHAHTELGVPVAKCFTIVTNSASKNYRVLSFVAVHFFTKDKRDPCTYLDNLSNCL